MEAKLIKRSEIEGVVAQELLSEEAQLEAAERVVGHLTGSIQESLQKQIDRLRGSVEALKQGFIPVNVDGLIRTNTKDKWRKPRVKAALASMPEEARQAWEEAEKLGLFKNFSITTGGDPVLVGNAGNKRFLIAVWVCTIGDGAIGFRFACKST